MPFTNLRFRSTAAAVPLTVSLSALLGLLPASIVCAQQGQKPARQTSAERAVSKAIAGLHRKLAAKLDIWVDHSSFENAWIAKTQHFKVHTTVSYAEAIDLATGLETMLGHFRRMLGTDYVPAKRLAVFVLPDRAAYNSFGENHGQNHSSFYGSFHALSHPEQPVAVEYTSNATLLRMQITHSVLHQYLHEAFPATQGRRPVWIEEGLAAYFTHYWDTAWTLSQYLSAKKDGRTVDLARMLVQPIASFGTDTDVRMLQLAIFYDYLLRLREDTKSAQQLDGSMKGPFQEFLLATLQTGNPVGLPFTDLLTNRKKLAEDFEDYDFGK